MFKSLRLFVPALVAFASLSAHGQFYKLHGDDISVGGTGQFSTILTANPTPYTFTGPGNVAVTSTPTRQDTTWSAGFIASMQIHPVAWAGVELNYGYTRYQERYSYDYSIAPGTTNTTGVPTDWHEATAGYVFHPRHIPFQPYAVLGGGAIAFVPAGGVTATTPTSGTTQWRGAGLLEMGFDIPTHSKHVAFRVSGRSLYYRSPNFDTPQISSRSWRVTTEPAVSVVYRF